MEVVAGIIGDAATLVIGGVKASAVIPFIGEVCRTVLSETVIVVLGEAVFSVNIGDDLDQIPAIGKISLALYDMVQLLLLPIGRTFSSY